MSENLSAHKFKHVFEDLGYDLSRLGCIMLDVFPSPDLLESVKGRIRPEDLYYAKDPSRFWIDGFTIDNLHVTLLYGLLRSGQELRKHVDAVLDDGAVLPKAVEIDHIGTFPSPFEDEPYGCVVAHLKITSELAEANERLKFLPHINTFPGYRAHMTLAYIRQEALSEELLRSLNDRLAGMSLSVTDLNYGSDKK